MTICVLMFRGRPIAAAERRERLNMLMANYTASDQFEMHIVEMKVLE